VSTTFAVGDEVVHPKKPEWGVGAVTKAEKAVHEGSPCQRLTIRFDKVGMKTVSTAFAALRPAGRAPSDVPESAADIQSLAAGLADLPPALTDRSAPALERIAGLLEEFRTDPERGDILGWSIRQTGLRDPLAVLSRGEIEQRLRTRQAAAARALARAVSELPQAERPRAELLARAGGEHARRAWSRATRGR